MKNSKQHLPADLSMSILSMVLVLSVMAVTHVQAGLVTWQTPVTISGDTDVATQGTLNRAYNMGGPATTVNGVVFARFAQNGQDGFDSDTYRTWTVGSTTLGDGSMLLYDPTSRGATVAPFSNLSAAYQTLLSSANYNTVDWSTISPLVLTLNGLTVGQKYLFQSWTNDSQNADHGRSLYVQSGGATSETVDFNTSDGDATGGVGQYLIGTFTADATSQVITYVGLDENVHCAEVGAFQLRSIPEPASLGLLALGSLALWRRRRD